MDKLGLQQHQLYFHIIVGGVIYFMYIVGNGISYIFISYFSLNNYLISFNNITTVYSTYGSGC